MPIPLTRDPFIVAVVTGENLRWKGRSKAWGLAPMGEALQAWRDSVLDVRWGTRRARSGERQRKV